MGEHDYLSAGMRLELVQDVRDVELDGAFTDEQACGDVAVPQACDHQFEHLAYIIGNVREPERLCVCLDTAHVFAAGYDISSEAATRKTFHDFDRVIGRERLAAVHLNDSKTARGSRVDRHQHIGQGQIGLDAFRFIMRDSRFRKIPKVLETPKGKEMREDMINLRTLRGLAKKQ